MANTYTQIGTEGAGKKKRSQTQTVGSDTVHVGYDVQLDATTGNAARNTNAIPTSALYGTTIRSEDLLDLGSVRTRRNFQSLAVSGGTTSPAFLSMTSYTDQTANAANTGFSVTSGKTFVLEYMIIQDRVVTSSTLFWVRMELRINTSGGVGTVSPIAAFLTVPGPNAVVGAGNVGRLDFRGIELPSGANFGFTRQDSGGVASRVTFDFYVGGYEY